MMGILSAIYSVFTPFMQNIGNVVNFNSAYYWALAWIERWQLILKYKQPWFEWSWWFLNSTNFWPESDTLTGNFWILTNNQNWFAWTIISRTNKIPKEWQWNVDYLLTSWTDSKNYNKLSYFKWEKIILTVDNTTSTNMYYTWLSNILDFTWWFFNWIIRLPPKAQELLGKNLCDTCDTDEDWISNDTVVNWIFDWINNWIPFTILPSISIFYYSWWIVDSTKDIAIREKVINETWLLDFWGIYNFSPLIYPNILTEHNVLSLDDSVKTLSFNSILDWSNSITWMKLWFWIINLLRTEDNEIYPFLEYQFSFPRQVSDSFFTLQWIWLVWDYNVKIFIKKSTNKESSSIGDFTIIF